MHIQITTRALLPGGGMGQPGQVLDLPDAEAAPLLKAGRAVAWPPVASESQAEAEDPSTA